MDTNRYEFEHIVIDVIKNADNTMEAIFKEGESGIIWMKPADNHDTHEHLSVEIFKVPEALEIFERSLKNIQTALGINNDYK